LVYPSSKRFFSAQTAGSLRGVDNVHDRTHNVMLQDVQTGVIFQNHSLITIESKFARSPRLKEYRIEYNTTHILHSEGSEIAKLSSKCDASSGVQIIPSPAHDDDSVAIVIYNLDRTVEWIKLEPFQGIQLI
jgi:hypothetical protein